MNTEKMLKESKMIMLVTLVVGIALLATGTGLNLLHIDLLPNRAIIGLSFIPLSVALLYYVKLSAIQRSPQKMRSIIVNEIDERLVGLKNEADAKALKIIQGALFLSYMGYTLMVPGDIFESIGWWILMILLLISFLSQGIILAKVMKNENSPKDDEEIDKIPFH